tara:strand:- start:967 stop:1242 length:276 start_codon:yes stop_codon:yes gene_type:complete
MLTSTVKKSTSTESQRSLLLDHLKKGPLTTIQARDELGVMSPAPRVMELRRQGHNIITLRTETVDRTGTKHREGQYILLTEEEREPVAAKV